MDLLGFVSHQLCRTVALTYTNILIMDLVNPPQLFFLSICQSIKKLYPRNKFREWPNLEISARVDFISEILMDGTDWHLPCTNRPINRPKGSHKCRNTRSVVHPLITNKYENFSTWGNLFFLNKDTTAIVNLIHGYAMNHSNNKIKEFSVFPEPALNISHTERIRDNIVNSPPPGWQSIDVLKKIASKVTERRLPKASQRPMKLQTLSSFIWQMANSFWQKHSSCFNFTAPD